MIMIPTYWRLSYMDRRSMMGRLTHYGWFGLAICPVSPFEIKTMRTFIAQLGSRNGRMFRPTAFPDDSHNEMIVREICVWTRYEHDFYRLIDVIENIPKRSETIALDKPLTVPQKKQLSGKNWCVYGEDELYLSCENFADLPKFLSRYNLAFVSEPPDALS